MALIDTYRNNMQRKRQEIVSLREKMAKESEKKTGINTKILSAKSAISRTKSELTIKSKLNEISRLEKSLSDIDKAIANLEKKIASKEKEYNTEAKKHKAEEEKQRKKQEQEDKQRQKVSERTFQKINQAIAAQQRQQSDMQNDIERLKAVPEKITVLFFATNPTNTSKLRLDEESRTIQEMIRKSEHRDSIFFESRWAVRPLDILQAINEVNPDVVHFSGHGASHGDLVLENTDGTAKFVTKEAITQTIMSSSDKIHLIFFNACFSYEQAQSVINYVDAAIGMTTSVGDAAACAFAAQFYSSLGFGFSVQKAFEQAKGVMMLEDPDECNTPELYVKDGVDVDTLFIVKPVEN
ncbi:CHAT domain-containing protein [Metallumcola ferriviriculae]|uniref:CHAT domain-containing protein n=1 Tax=Metallumcola ferriviriculae TaxID=3039180 RepID=A0AAU0UPP5_9FIRM|nr:CHAT domain-containing protein [Desulfitibacteraceae bacterium MK1]